MTKLMEKQKGAKAENAQMHHKKKQPKMQNPNTFDCF